MPFRFVYILESPLRVHRDQVDHLFVAYREPVFRFLRQFVRDATSAEDLTQETFLRALRASYTANGQERAWIFQIARNLARDHLRARGRAAVTTELGEHAVVSADPVRTLELKTALLTLADDDREVFLLKEVAGLAYAEIADACGLTPDAVRSRLHRARLALRRQMK